MLKPKSYMLFSICLLLVIYIVSRYTYFNPSNSEPIGYYLAYATQNYKVGDRVLICLNKQPWVATSFKLGLPKGDSCSSKTPYLLKTIIARNGDIVTIGKSGVYVNKRLIKDSVGLQSYEGHQLYPQVIGKTFRLNVDEFFVLGDGLYSFDSRYFGVISQVDIIYKTVLLWHLD